MAQAALKGSIHCWAHEQRTYKPAEGLHPVVISAVLRDEGLVASLRCAGGGAAVRALILSLMKIGWR